MIRAIFHTILNVHILLGFVGLVTFWISALAQKGSALHLGGVGGAGNAIGHLSFLFRDLAKPLDPRTYFFRHLNYMIGSGIALHTAFLAGGAASRYFPWLSLRTGYLFWFLPLVIGTGIQTMLVKKYARAA